VFANPDRDGSLGRGGGRGVKGSVRRDWSMVRRTVGPGGRPRLECQGLMFGREEREVNTVKAGDTTGGAVSKDLLTRVFDRIWKKAVKGIYFRE
jgi:hypothetical protein